MNITPGDTVHILDRKTKIGNYSLSGVVQLHKSHDGQIWSVSLILPNKTFTNRLLSLIAALELYTNAILLQRALKMFVFVSHMCIAICIFSCESTLRKLLQRVPTPTISKINPKTNYSPALLTYNFNIFLNTHIQRGVLQRLFNDRRCHNGLGWWFDYRRTMFYNILNITIYVFSITSNRRSDSTILVCFCSMVPHV